MNKMVHFVLFFLAYIGVENSKFWAPWKPQAREERLWRLSHTQLPNRNRLQKKSPWERRRNSGGVEVNKGVKVTQQGGVKV